MIFCEDCFHCYKQTFPYLCKEAQERDLVFQRCEDVRRAQPFGTCSMYMASVVGGVNFKPEENKEIK